MKRFRERYRKGRANRWNGLEGAFHGASRGASATPAIVRGRYGVRMVVASGRARGRQGAHGTDPMFRASICYTFRTRALV